MLIYLKGSQMSTYQMFLAKSYSFKAGIQFSELTTIKDITDKVKNDELTIYYYWKPIFNLITPDTLASKYYWQRPLVIYLNDIKIPYKPRATTVGANEVCTICYEQMSKSPSKKLPCGHIFHGNCIESWFFRDLRLYWDKFTCPYCRMNLFDWFFFKYYKANFILYCEKKILSKNKQLIKSTWDE